MARNMRSCGYTKKQEYVTYKRIAVNSLQMAIKHQGEHTLHMGTTTKGTNIAIGNNGKNEYYK